MILLHEASQSRQFAILPLSNKPELTAIAEQLFADMSKKYRIDVDLTGSIGKRYRRQDEIGTPACLTVDFDTKHDNCVTVRDRDTMHQVRVGIPQVISGEFPL